MQKSDALPLNAWNSWAKEVGCLNLADILGHLEKDGAYLLPCRIPETDPERIDTYLNYFSAMSVECDLARKA